ncbi:tRNA-specific adenosine deaminase [Stieleria maiorica]|uniref:tRNA-specific adenosine deaminase n=1 Tax=Stieleria maiorica TaxID=2795974 RepID=A0A5B9MKF6_9BACT|nr:nucleoside deaminase [Stieleria maiorica]QEG00467.1 tRNA-specific adenosine deaminase [Stieleria maiorica]
MEFSNERLVQWMSTTLDKAWSGVADGENPFAASVYSPNRDLVACEHNTARGQTQPSRHGEVNAIDRACQELGTTDLSGCVLVSTGEPCPMCTSAALLAKIDIIVFGAGCDVVAKSGYGGLGIGCEELIEVSNAHATVIGGIAKQQCEKLLLDNSKDG